MSIFKTIGNAFKDGWYKNDREKNTDSSNYFTLSADYINSIKTSTFLSLDNVDNNNKNNTVDNSTSNYYYTSYVFENNFKLSSSILNSASKNYKFVYDQAAMVLLDFGYDNKDKDTKQLTYTFTELGVIPSMFNPLYGLNIVGIGENTPLLDTDKTINKTIDSENPKESQFTVTSNGINIDIQDCSIKTLVKLSNENKLGREIYKFADFMYCKQLGKFSNNRLITLRKFPIPVGDDITSIANIGSTGSTEENGDVRIPGDVGRMVCWMDDDNKLESILRYEYKETWREEKGEYQDINSKTANETSSWIGSFVNLANPQYRKEVGAGWNSGSNKILSAFNAKVFHGNLLSDSEGSNYSNNAELLTRYDAHKVYEPTGTIKSTHLYEGTLEFTHNFSLIFDYELRAYDNINPRAAFLDLLNNIHQVTYRSGKFWGGDTWWIGSPYNKQGWQNTEKMISGSYNKLTSTFRSLLLGEISAGDILGGLANLVGNAEKKGQELAEEIANDPTSIGKKIVEAADKLNIPTMLYGMMRNKLGRPSLYASNSILTGDPVGLWHVTIGNPRNPILSIGNLIIDSSSIQHYGPLGFDDFPTGLKVTVNLKHGRPRDMVEIGKMYTRGKSGLAIPLSRGAYSKYIQPTKMSTVEFESMWASTTPPVSSGIVKQKD